MAPCDTAHCPFVLLDEGIGFLFLSGCADTLCAADSPDLEQMNLSLFPKERALSLPPSLFLFQPLPSSLSPSLSERWGENGAR